MLRAFRSPEGKKINEEEFMKNFLKVGELGKKNSYSLWFSIFVPEVVFSVCLLRQMESGQNTCGNLTIAHV